MKLKMMAVRDRKAEFFFPPFFARNNVEGIRVFERLMNDPNRMGPKEDYELVEVAEFCDQTGVVVPQMLSSIVVSGGDFANSGG